MEKYKSRFVMGASCCFLAVVAELASETLSDTGSTLLRDFGFRRLRLLFLRVGVSSSKDVTDFSVENFKLNYKQDNMRKMATESINTMRHDGSTSTRHNFKLALHDASMY